LEQNVRRLSSTWQELPPIRKGLLAGTGFALVALLYLLYSWSSSSSYVTLYAGLEPTDSSTIVDQLRSSGTDYRLEADGSRVLVPESQIDELRMNFAAQGLPEGGHVGFEIFEGNSFTATDFVQRLNFQRGLQGELERTILTFPQVSGARVHIVMPERTLFREDDEPATASVVLQLQSGRGLTVDEVAGVAHLVSGAVAGLDKQHITILDSRGSILYDGSTAGEGGLAFTSNQQSLVREYEDGLTRDAQSMLDRSIGPGNSIVTVRATLNFDQVETQTSTFGEQGVPLSTSAVSENYTTNGEGTVGAIPGAVTNVPGANADLPGGTTSTGTSTTPSSTQYERTETTSNFEVPETRVVSKEATGDVERITVSLVIDEIVPEAQATALSNAVAAAVSLDLERGDAIVMSRVAVDRTVVESATVAFAAAEGTQTILTYARLALPVLVLLIAFFFFRMLMKSISRRGGYQVGDVDDYNAMLAAGMQPALAGGASGMLPVAISHILEDTDPEEMKSDLERQVTKLAESHPDTVAEVVQSWLRED